MEVGSKLVATAAIKMALSLSRQEEGLLKKSLLEEMAIKAVAVDYGGEFITSAAKIVERAVVSAKREGVIKDCHADEGAVAGATREALAQIMPKALGLNVGGKIGIARHGDHISVAIFFGIGLLHLDEVAIGLGHRAVA
ncbi:MAG TPA: HutP family protein [Syntrophomonas sp.]|nr:HutP family protein [Syntrophomonas sp.]HPT69923.1 HutP family protein [Syntrophomonas sp.]